VSRDGAQEFREAEFGLSTYLDAIRHETINADWPIRAEQLLELHEALVHTFEDWMRRHGRLPR